MEDSQDHAGNLQILSQSNFLLVMLNLSLIDRGSEFDIREFILPVYDAVSQYVGLTHQRITELVFQCSDLSCLFVHLFFRVTTAQTLQPAQ